MKKTIFWIVGIVLLFIVIIVTLKFSGFDLNKLRFWATSTDYKNTTYSIEGENITLVNGTAEEASAPDSVSKTITSYFGNKVVGDFNGDGKTDIIFLLTQETGGTGIFYYIALALGDGSSYKGVNTIFLGDRIAPQNTEFRDGEIIVNYADRKLGDPFSAEPSVGVSKYFKVVNDNLVEISK
jgi:hypothetical protein